MSKPRIAFFGLGIMGTGMARRLLGAGFPVAVYNRNRAKADALAKEGAVAARSPREAAKGADILISMVADDEASRGMWLGKDGALAGAKSGAVIIESSTLTVDWIKELAQAAAAHGCDCVDAPVTGTKPHAASGELNFLVGGTAEAIEKARPALAVMGKSIVHLGPTGSGALMKLINNFMSAVQAAALAEGLAIVEKSGLDRVKALDLITNGTPGSPLVKALAARMTARDYTPNFLLRLMVKDIEYALKQANQMGVKMTAANAALDVFKSAVAAGHGEKDLAAVVEQFR